MTNNIELVEVHVMAQFFYSRSSADSIIILTDRPNLLAGQYPIDSNIIVVCSKSDVKNYEDIFRKIDRPKFQCITIQELTSSFLLNKVFVCIDYTPKKSFFSIKKNNLLKLADKAMLSILVNCLENTDKYEVNSLMVGRAPRLVGDQQKDQSIVIAGRLINIHKNNYPLLPVLSIIHTYNEADIIFATINHLLSQGTDVHIIDNWSNDGTYEIITDLAIENHRVTYERFPKKNNKEFALSLMLSRATEVAKEKPQYAWVMLNDSDEIRWSPWKGVSLQEAFSFVDSLGFNSIDYTVFNFEPTKEGFSSKDNPISFFKYGSFGTLPGYFAQIKSWKNNKEAELAPSGGHHVAFPDQRIFPLKFFLGHYPVRSTQHAISKIFRDRVGRYSRAEKDIGWHTHYNNVKKTSKFIKNPKTNNLLEFNQNEFYRDFIIERISGVGLKVDKDN